MDAKKLDPFSLKRLPMQTAKAKRARSAARGSAAGERAKLELILNYSVLPEQAEQIGLPRDKWRRGGQTF